MKMMRSLGVLAGSLLVASVAVSGCSPSASQNEAPSVDSAPLPYPDITLVDAGWSDGSDDGDEDGAVWSRGFLRTTPDGSKVFCFSVWTRDSIPDSWHCVPQVQR